LGLKFPSNDRAAAKYTGPIRIEMTLALKSKLFSCHFVGS
jgi:hypothetical protein